MWGLGRDGEEETVSIVSIPHSDVQLLARVVQTLDSAIHDWSLFCDRLLQHLLQSFGFAHAEFYIHVKDRNPPTPHLLMF